eukprot:s244_g33.t1
MFARLLHDLHGQLRDLQLLECYDHAGPGLHPTVEQAPQSQPHLGPVWMDDLCITLSDPTAQGVEHKAGVAFGVLLDLCRHYGVTPNLQKGKSEVLFAFRGSGSRRLRTKYYGPEQGHRMPVVTEVGIGHVSVVGNYQHLGGQAHHSGETRKDMRQRIALGHSTFATHRKTLFQNPHLSLVKRREMFQTLVLSKILYGTESWVLTDRSAKFYFHSAIIRLYRRVLRLPHDDHRTDDEIITAVELPTPSTLLRIARLRY